MTINKELKGIQEAKKKFKKEILDWCYKHNTIPMKDLFKDLPNSKLRLATTNGGWVNVLELQKFLEEKYDNNRRRT